MEPTDIHNLYPNTCVELGWLSDIVSPSASVHSLHSGGRNEPCQLHVSYIIQGTAKTLHSKEVKPVRQNKPDPAHSFKRRPRGVPETVNSEGNVALSQKDLKARAVTKQRGTCKNKESVDLCTESNTLETKSDSKINIKNSGLSQCKTDNLNTSASNVCRPVNAPDSRSNTKMAVTKSNFGVMTMDTSKMLKIRLQDLHLNHKTTNEDHIFDQSMETASRDILHKSNFITEMPETENNNITETATKLESDDESPTFSSPSQQLWRTNCTDIDDSPSETGQLAKSNGDRLEKYKYSYLYGTDNSSNNENRIKLPISIPPPQYVKLSKEARIKTSNVVNKKKSDNKAGSSQLYVSGQRASPISLSRKNESMRVYETTESYRISRTERYVKYLLWKESSARSKERLASSEIQRPWKPNY